MSALSPVYDTTEGDTRYWQSNCTGNCRKTPVKDLTKTVVRPLYSFFIYSFFLAWPASMDLHHSKSWLMYGIIPYLQETDKHHGDPLGQLQGQRLL